MIDTNANENDFFNKMVVGKKMKSFAAFIVMLSLVLSLLFSYMFVIEELHHDCCGEDCPICEQIKITMHNISTVRFLASAVFALSFLCVFLCTHAEKLSSNRMIISLITLKVELLD